MTDIYPMDPYSSISWGKEPQPNIFVGAGQVPWMCKTAFWCLALCYRFSKQGCLDTVALEGYVLFQIVIVSFVLSNRGPRKIEFLLTLFSKGNLRRRSCQSSFHVFGGFSWKGRAASIQEPAEKLALAFTEAFSIGHRG